MPLFTNQPAPWIISSDAVAVSAATGTLAANVVYLYAFELAVQVTVTNMKVRITATATGTTDMGIYDVNGNLLTHTGAVTNTANTTMTNALSGGNFTLGPGQYFLALCPSNSTDTYQRVSPGNSYSPVSRMRQATNAGSAGVLPATTGGNATSTTAPAFAALLVGGLT